MILIFTQPIDSSTNFVISWINYYGISWKRINQINSNNTSVCVQVYNTSSGEEICCNEEITAVWYRRLPKTILPFSVSDMVDHSKLKQEITSHFSNEYYAFFASLCTALIDKNSLGNPRLSDLNKFYQLQTAKNNKLKIPATIITNNKTQLFNFKKQFKKIIIKPLSNPVVHNVKEKVFVSYTSILSKTIINKLNDYFYPTLLQEYIEKKIEVRSFYLNGKFYSMAIFSQVDKQTSIDFRKYNDFNPNRTIPYKLPVAYEKKLSKFMKAVGLNSGSIDIIVNKKGEYVFLEVNPDGQFGMVSYPCNYYLEQKVAHYLIGKTE